VTHNQLLIETAAEVTPSKPSARLHEYDNQLHSSYGTNSVTVYKFSSVSCELGNNMIRFTELKLNENNHNRKSKTV